MRGQSEIEDGAYVEREKRRKECCNEERIVVCIVHFCLHRKIAKFSIAINLHYLALSASILIDNCTISPNHDYCECDCGSICFYLPKRIILSFTNMALLLCPFCFLHLAFILRCQTRTLKHSTPELSLKRI
jgi:hypothetical protein